VERSVSQSVGAETRGGRQELSGGAIWNWMDFRRVRAGEGTRAGHRARAPNARAGVRDGVDVSSDARGFARTTRRAIDAPRDGGKGRIVRSGRAESHLRPGSLVLARQLQDRGEPRELRRLLHGVHALRRLDPRHLQHARHLVESVEVLRRDISPGQEGVEVEIVHHPPLHRRLLRGEGVGRGRAARGSGGRHGGRPMDRSRDGGSRVGALSCPSARLATPAAMAARCR